ncbi:MAG: hypothetical protein QM535_18675 [Limnohabitans sp.]|nr:hypothetical protein [Limnohabitans sp.]
MIFSQVGIGTTTPNAALDITSSTQGVLTPRVALSATNVTVPVVNPAGGGLATSTLVYNTATAGTYPNNVIPGYYYWDGTKWVRLNTESSWLVNGNSNTNPNSNFLGTLDNNDLVFRRNNIISGRLATSNTSFGVDALSNASTTGLRTVAYGVNTLKALTSGSDNVAVGYGALEANTSGFQNVAVGSASLSLNTSGNYNTAIGYNAMSRNASGILNTAVGNSSLFNNLMGNNNVGLGYSALQRNFSGSYNVAVGTNAVYNNQTGNNNVGIGESALERNISGGNNVAIGASSLFNNQSSSNNTSIGYQSQLNNLTGQNNTSLGYQSLFSNNAGSNDVGIGYQALYSLTSGSRNIALGDNAGYNITTANNNTFVGYNTGTTISTGSNNTIIGANVSLPAATTGNIVLADGAGNRRINVDQNGNVGIATTAPTAQLHTTGTVRHETLSGTGTRMVVSDATGNLSTQAIPGGGTLRTVTANTTVLQSDNSGFIYVNSATAVTITIPSTLTVGFNCVIVRKGTGAVNVVGSGVTLQTARGLNARAQYSAMGVIIDTATTATITGDGI